MKPHASPVFHTIQYLLGRQSKEKLAAFRAYKRAQSYPSRTKTPKTSISRVARSVSGSRRPCFQRSCAITCAPTIGERSGRKGE